MESPRFFYQVDAKWSFARQMFVWLIFHRPPNRLKFVFPKNLSESKNRYWNGLGCDFGYFWDLLWHIFFIIYIYISENLYFIMYYSFVFYFPIILILASNICPKLIHFQDISLMLVWEFYGAIIFSTSWSFYIIYLIYIYIWCEKIPKSNKVKSHDGDNCFLPSQ